MLTSKNWFGATLLRMQIGFLPVDFYFWNFAVKKKVFYTCFEFCCVADKFSKTTKSFSIDEGKNVSLMKRSNNVVDLRIHKLMFGCMRVD